MAIVREFEVPLYPVSAELWIVDDDLDFQKTFYERVGKEPESYMSNSQGIAIRTRTEKTSNLIILVLKESHAFHHGIVSHECFHLTEYVHEIIGADHVVESSENWAYLLTFFVDTVWELLYEALPDTRLRECFEIIKEQDYIFTDSQKEQIESFLQNESAEFYSGILLNIMNPEIQEAESSKEIIQNIIDKGMAQDALSLLTKNNPELLEKIESLLQEVQNNEDTKENLG